MTLLADVVAASDAATAISARSGKIAAIADLLRRLGPSEVAPVVCFLSGEPRQGRFGVGWRTLTKLDYAAAPAPQLTIGEVDEVLTRVAATTGSGSGGSRAALLGDLLAGATSAEAGFLQQLLTGGLRQGALEGVMVEAVANAAAVPASAVRRTLMLCADLGHTAEVALTEGIDGLDRIGLTVGRFVQPMLASTATSLAASVEALAPVSVEWKLDGIRIQVHRDGDSVTVFSRGANDITAGAAGVVEVARSLPAERVVLDGELRGEPAFFDCLHLDGDDLIDLPLERRLAAVERVASRWRIRGAVTSSADEAQHVADDALAAGHEGVVVKALSSPYEAGRRGKAWQKVKPVITLDLVVLAAEWGHGRRTGWLSNLHLGARGPDGKWVMVGKTFKGMTDDLLRWQTDEFRRRVRREDDWVVWVRPEMVVEIAVDGVQESTRYGGGVVLRFARVVRYRPDKSAAEADTIETVRALRQQGG